MTKAEARKRLAELREQLDALQNVFAAARSHALLLILQGMDTSGKDGAITHVLSGMNPQGVDVHSFKQPTSEELAHEFLWRSAIRLPERGRIGVFNRSYYEEVIVVRVHAEDLAGEGIAPAEDVWQRRFEDINAFERHLVRNNTLVLKFFLDVSRGEQRKRLLERLEDPQKHWKFSIGDVREREFWDRYQAAYRAMLDATDTAWAPWHRVDADHKWAARAEIARVIAERLTALHLTYPPLEGDLAGRVDRVRHQLETE